MKSASPGSSYYIPDLNIRSILVAYFHQRGAVRAENKTTKMVIDTEFRKIVYIIK